MGLSLEQVQHILAVPPGRYGSEVERVAPTRWPESGLAAGKAAAEMAAEDPSSLGSDAASAALMRRVQASEEAALGALM